MGNIINKNIRNIINKNIRNINGLVFIKNITLQYLVSDKWRWW